MFRTRSATPSSSIGFTLLELMITVAVIGILAAIAIPMYGDSVMRSKIIGGTTQLGDVRTQMEKYFMDNRSYLAGAGCGAAPSIVSYNADASNNFTLSCPAPTATTYTIQADGKVAKGMGGFTYTINEQNIKTTFALPGGWAGAGSACWVLRKDGSC